jgi:hypothetical protein
LNVDRLLGVWLSLLRALHRGAVFGPLFAVEVAKARGAAVAEFSRETSQPALSAVVVSAATSAVVVLQVAGRPQDLAGRETVSPRAAYSRHRRLLVTDSNHTPRIPILKQEASGTHRQRARQIAA